MSNPYLNKVLDPLLAFGLEWEDIDAKSIHKLKKYITNHTDVGEFLDIVLRDYRKSN